MKIRMLSSKFRGFLKFHTNNGINRFFLTKLLCTHGFTCSIICQSINYSIVIVVPLGLAFCFLIFIYSVRELCGSVWPSPMHLYIHLFIGLVSSGITVESMLLRKMNAIQLQSTSVQRPVCTKHHKINFNGS
jgi:hypothetical protein